MTKVAQNWACSGASAGPASGMPAFDLPPAQSADVAAFLHSLVVAAAFRNAYQIGNILVG